MSEVTTVVMFGIAFVALICACICVVAEVRTREARDITLAATQKTMEPVEGATQNHRPVERTSVLVPVEPTCIVEGCEEGRIYEHLCFFHLFEDEEGET